MTNFLYKLYQQDQSDRRRVFGRNGDKDASVNEIRQLEQMDAQRQKMLKLYLKRHAVKTAREYYWIAMLLQHGKTEKEYRMAHAYAEKSQKLGYTRAAWLSAASLDRYLKSIGRCQKFGTQFYKRRDGAWRIWPLLKSTTDEDRARFGVDSLKELRTFANRLNRHRGSR